MPNELATVDQTIIEELILKGDISNLTPPQRVQYYTSMCKNLGIDPLTQPFSIIKLQGRETFYANKNCTQQLAKVYRIGLEVLKTEMVKDVYMVTVRASDGKRHTDEIGAVTIGKHEGDNLANALMKASTKAKRRAVLAFCGLGILDETELETVRGVERVIEPLKIDMSDVPKPEEQTITAEQLSALIKTLEKNGYTQIDLDEMTLFSYEKEAKDLTNKEILEVKEYFKKKKMEKKVETGS